jgi:hypothetical protein
MSSNKTFTPKNYKQNPTVYVEAVSLDINNADEVVKWINQPDTELFKTTVGKNVILSIFITTPNGKISLRSGEFLVRYYEPGGKFSFQTMTRDQFMKRFETTATANTPPEPGENKMNPWGWGTKDG